MKRTIKEKSHVSPRISHNSGITLVALIITIIVLLILAVVAIREVTGDGIIAHAKNARTEYEKAQTAEQDVLSEYELLLAQETGKAWKQEGSTLTKTNADGTKSQVKIGDYVNYNEGSYTHTPIVANGAGTSQTDGSVSTGYTLATSELTTENLTWRVLGVNKKGELELISADPTTQVLYLANDKGYVNAEDNLNNFCNDLYGKGQYATGARSLNVEDINKLTNYDPATYSGYGNKWTYKYPTDAEVESTTGLTENMWYKTEKPDKTSVTNWTNITSGSYQTFRLPEETTAISSTNPGSRELTYSYYSYSISSNLTTDDGFTADEATEISNMITKGTISSNSSQWLASRCVYCVSYGARFYVHLVIGGTVNFSNLFGSYGNFYYANYSVRPIVSLSSGISLTGSGDDVGSAVNMWSIS